MTHHLDNKSSAVTMFVLRCDSRVYAKDESSGKNNHIQCSVTFAIDLADRQLYESGTHSFSNRRFNPVLTSEAARKAAEHGWTLDGGNARCPTCTKKLRDLYRNCMVGTWGRQLDI